MYSFLVLSHAHPSVSQSRLWKRVIPSEHLEATIPGTVYESVRWYVDGDGLEKEKRKEVKG